ncbi:3-oxoacyl-ACP synthase III family protein [Treponema primitia]|uniref:3-oxoacyl-ACP synthase III family protein n=1 Tax=Treponema primitia TaxID=88058 RepID=UPI0002555565|nr:ketoacyl-ACP synthase III [Treponema primitia]
MAKWKIKNVSLKGVAACVPKNIIRTEDIPLFSKKEELEHFLLNVGIKTRRVVEKGVCASDLCFEAAKKLIDSLGWDKNEIGALIFVSITADYRSPMTSCILQDRLGLPESCFTLDIPSACCGYPHGMTVLSSLMTSGSIRKGLLLAGDTCYQMASPEDKSRFPVFGDAGTASAFEYDELSDNIVSYAYTDGNGYEAIITPHSGFRHPVTPESFIVEDVGDGNRRAPVHALVKGMDVFSFAISKAPKLLKEVLLDNNIDKDNGINYFLLHQANQMITDKIISKTKLDKQKVPCNIEEFANTTCATIPLLMVTRIKNDLIKNDLNLILLAFGVGLTWGCVYMKTHKIVCSDLIEL